MPVISVRMHCEPVTLAERQRRGHLDGLTRGFGPDVDPLDHALHLTSSLHWRRCTACGRADLGWQAYTDGQITRAWRECRVCRHSEEVTS